MSLASPQNIQRDATYVNIDQARKVRWSTTEELSNRNGKMTADPAVNYGFAQAQAHNGFSITVPVGSYAAIGVWMTPPVGDRWPFRIKASVSCPEKAVNHGTILLGWQTPAAPLPDQDITVPQPDINLQDVYHIPFLTTYDGLIIVEALPEGHQYYGQPLGIALAITPQTALSTDVCIGELSVQNLGTKPPTMQNAVS